MISVTDNVTFREYLSTLRTLRLRSDARGDFLRLATADPSLPDLDSKEAVRAYASTRFGNPIITEAALDVWKQYEAQMCKQRRRHSWTAPPGAD
jgi:hypothetical protein